MKRDSISNREKIYSAGGEALFGKVYNCAEAPSGGFFQPLISTYRATRNIMKSPNARNNRNKICKKGRILCVIGAVTDDDDDGGSRDYLVFSEDTWVFKREWAELKDFVVPVGVCLQRAEITKTGATKYKGNRKKCHEQQPQQQQRFDYAFAVQFTNDPRSTVWFTQTGLQYLAEQTCTLSEARLLPQSPQSLCLFPHWPQPCDTLAHPPLAQDCLTECTDNTSTDIIHDTSDDSANKSDGNAHERNGHTKHQCQHPPQTSSPPTASSLPQLSSVDEELEDLLADPFLSDVHDLFYPYV